MMAIGARDPGSVAGAAGVKGQRVEHFLDRSDAHCGAAAAVRRNQSCRHSLHRQPAAMYAKDGIRVNCIAPGSIEFPGGVWDRRKSDNPRCTTRVLSSIPFGRLGHPEEIANVALFLASPFAGWVHRANHRSGWRTIALTERSHQTTRHQLPTIDGGEEHQFERQRNDVRRQHHHAEAHQHAGHHHVDDQERQKQQKPISNARRSSPIRNAA